ncbi:MAG TPA: cobalamin-dependent protein, partial [Niabella sp.]|nr:cobalamin-dependent protein [Niabella sp.]
MNKTQTTTIRIVTAASLFDGHDAAINIMRRILQSKGAEIIHLGHNRSVHEIVECAIEEDAHAIAITSYQGGHIEFFKYMFDMLQEAGCGHIKIFGGGGGTILPAEIDELHDYGIEHIYSPDDGRRMGLEGMIEDLLVRAGKSAYFEAAENWDNVPPLGESKDIRRIARAITHAELGLPVEGFSLAGKDQSKRALLDEAVVLGITGTGGAGKSSVTDEIVRRFLHQFPDRTIAVISVDPSRKKTGGALLGDRIRMNAISHPRAYMRSMATRNDHLALSQTAREAINICRAAGFNLVILESAGVGQSDASIVDYCDLSLYVMTPEYGAASQLEKINMLDYADIICINKFDKPGALDALQDVKKQYRRNHQLWAAKEEDIPVIGTIAAQFNDWGVNELFERIVKTIEIKTDKSWGRPVVLYAHMNDTTSKTRIIPAKQVRYLSEITEAIKVYDQWVATQSALASQLYQLEGAKQLLENAAEMIEAKKQELLVNLEPGNKELIDKWPAIINAYNQDY